MDKKPIKKQITVEMLMQERDKHKEQFNQWKIEHVNAQGTTDYENYITAFNRYEVDMNAKIAELQANSTVTVVRESVDAQLHTLLARCTKEEFILAFLHASNEDPSLIKTVTDVSDFEDKLVFH